MNDDTVAAMQRRRFLKLVSTGAVLVPFVGLAACGGEREPAQSGAAQPAPAEPGARPAAVPEAEPMPQAPAEAAPAEEQMAAAMPHLEESDPQAKALSYVNDAATVQAARFPQFVAGSVCANCALYTGEAGAAWGPCSIFPGKQVNAKGWCSVYAPKP